MKYWITLSGALLGAVNSYSQIRVGIGPQVSLGVAGARYEVDRKYHTVPVLSAAGGTMFSLGWQRWSLQTSLLYAKKGFRLEDEFRDPGPGVRITRLDTKETYRLYYLTLPISVAFAQHPNGQGFQVFAGGYLSRLLGGSQHYDSEGELQTNSGTVPYRSQGTNEVVPANETPEPSSPSNRPLTTYSQYYDSGVQGGVGYQWQRLLVQATYSRGLANLFPPYRPGSTY